MRAENDSHAASKSVCVTSHAYERELTSPERVRPNAGLVRRPGASQRLFVRVIKAMLEDEEDESSPNTLTLRPQVAAETNRQYHGAQQ